MKNRVELEDAMAEIVLEDMDMDTMFELAQEYLHQQLDKLSMVELEAEVKDFYPDMIETNEKERT